MDAKSPTHKNSFKHLQNKANLKILGTVDIRSQIDLGYKLGVQRHNKIVIF